MQPKQLFLAIGISIVLSILLVLYVFIPRHPTPTDPYQPVNITNDPGYNEANKEAMAFGNAVFPKVAANQPLSPTDIDSLTKAIRLYDGMIAYKPNNPLPGLTAGEAFLALNDNDRAIQSFQQFLLSVKNAKDPRYILAASDAHFLLSKAYFNLLQYPQSLNEVNIALAMYPKTASYLTQRAGIYLQMKNPKAALADAHAALKLDPNDEHAKGIASLLKGSNQ